MPHPSLRLTPHAHLVFEDSSDAPELDARVAARLAEAFSRGSGEGLLRLGAGEVGQACRRSSCGGADLRRATWPRLCLQSSAEVAAPTDSRTRVPGVDGADDAGGGIPDDGRAAHAVAGDRRGAGGVACRGKNRPAELPQGAESRLEPGRSRALQPGGEPPRRRSTVRLPRHLHDPALRPGARAARAARPGAARIRRRGQSREAAVAAAAGAARRRDLRLAPAMVDAGELYHPLRWTPREASRLLGQRARPGACRRRRAHAAVVAGQPSAAAAGDGHRRRAQALGARARGRAGLPHGRDAGRRDAEREGDRRAAVRHRLAGAAARPMGRDRSRAPRALDPAVPRGRATGGARRSELRRGHAHAGRGRGRRCGERCRRRRLVARDGRPVARGDAAAAALARRCRCRSKSRAARHAAPVSARRHAVAATAVGARPRRLPRRRHGAGQDDPGAGAAAGTAARAEPAGGARIAAGQLGGGDGEIRARPEGGDRASLRDDRPSRSANSRRRGRRNSIWRSPATARCCASRRCPRSSGAMRSSTRRRRSRTRTRSRRARRRH